MIFFDTETIGLHGPIVLFQYAYGDGTIILYEPFQESIRATKELIEKIVNHDGGICGFNLVFDWFHVCQMYTTLLLMDDDSQILGNCIEEYALKEEQGRLGPCLRPKHCLDLMLHARKGPYQSTMDRGAITVKKIPKVMANELAIELGKRVALKDVYFAKNADPKVRWSVRNIEGDDDFKNLVLKFAPSSSLKALAEDALSIDSATRFKEIGVTKKALPTELGYAPFATAIGEPGHWNGAWPDWGRVRVHIDHWRYNKAARKYAESDVDYTRRLYYYFDKPEVDDDDSILACMIGAVRWHGFKIDRTKIQNLKIKSQNLMKSMKFNFNSPKVCAMYLRQVMTEQEQVFLIWENKTTTKSKILEDIIKWKISTTCESCYGEGCEKCDEGLMTSEIRHPAAVRAEEILSARRAKHVIKLCDKLLNAKRFHASFKVIGTLSSRMSGSDKFNPQGINRSTEVRRCFTLADDEYHLSGGDFDSQEVSIMQAAYKDEVMRIELESGKKIHALAGEMFFPGWTYEQILATKGLPNEKDKYSRSKNGVFALAYGGEAYTLANRVGIPESIGEQAFEQWKKKYVQWTKNRKEITNKFQGMKQPNGIGTRVEWHEPDDNISSLLGFKRYFTLENQICKALFDLAERPPAHWKQIPNQVIRRDRKQTVGGATQSALFAAAFAIQAANMRAAANHVIQSTGAELTKKLEVRLWNLQPKGICEFKVLPFNIHDEIMSPMSPELQDQAKGIVDIFIKEYQKVIPLLKMDWSKDLESWADK